MSHFTGSTLITRESDDGEVVIEVEYKFYPGSPAVMYLSNGDPGYPAEPNEVEIVSAKANGVEVELTDAEIEQVEVAAEENISEPDYDEDHDYPDDQEYPEYDDPMSYCDEY